MRIRRALPRLALPARTPRSVRRLTGIASEPLILMLPLLVLVYFIFGGFHYVMISVAIGCSISHFAQRLRRKYGLDDQVDDPTKPERFYH